MENQSNSQSPASSDAFTRVRIPESWQVPEEFRRRLGDHVGRQRAMLADGHLLLILHSPPTPDGHDRHGRLFWRQPSGEWKSFGSDRRTPDLTGHLKEYRDRIEELEAREAVAETSEDYFQIVSDLLPVYRAARNQHEAIQHARRETLDARDVINFRDEAYEIERMAELLHADAKNALDFLIVQRAEEQAKLSHHMGVASHRLNVLVAFFFPIATLCSIFGTNLLHGYEEKFVPYPFLGMLLSGLLFGLVLTRIITSQTTTSE